MRILVDADAMPSIKAIEFIAINYHVPCILICDDTHQIKSDYSEVIIVSKGYQSVDMYLINYLVDNDIVITQDYGLALLALTKKVSVIHPKGMIYTRESIDLLLDDRYRNQRLRKQGIHVKGPKKRNHLDEEKLIKSLITCIEQDCN